MLYNPSVRNQAMSDHASKTYYFRYQVNQAYYALVDYLKTALSWQNLLLTWLGIISVQMLFIAFMLIKISL